MVPLGSSRITASVIKDACQTNQEHPAKSLIKIICYKNKFRNIVTNWGCMQEDEARAAFVDFVSKEHQNFSIKTSGLIINLCWSYIGALPDGIAECSCCNVRCIEIIFHIHIEIVIFKSSLIMPRIFTETSIQKFLSRKIMNTITKCKLNF